MSGDVEAAREVVEEVLGLALGAGVNIEQATPREPGLTEARELMSSVMPLLEVQKVDCAAFSDGRVTLELDGVTHLLRAETARWLTQRLTLLTIDTWPESEGFPR